MSTVIKKKDSTRKRRIIRLIGLCMSIFGFVILIYLSYPLLAWKIFDEPVFATQAVTAPIPQTTVLNRDTIRTLLTATANTLIGVDYTDVNNWYPSYRQSAPPPKVSMYFMSIPAIKVQNAIVSTMDTSLKDHLVHYQGTAIPPDKGTAVVFGHSTLPQLFDPTNYKTIFAYAHTLKVGDKILVTVNNVMYTYKIVSVRVTDPEDTSILAQEYDDSYLVLITCTPPGTIWKRLVVKSRLELP